METEQQQVKVDKYKNRTAHRAIPPKNASAIEILDSFVGDDEDDEEQRTSWQFLRAALDEDRPEGLKLFI